MASTNQSPFYKKAEENFLKAETDEDRLYWLDEMIKECPKHKSSEKMLSNLKTRRIKLMEKIDRIKKSKKSSASKDSIKKSDMQAVLIGFTNSGKSSLLKTLTNSTPIVSPVPFTTQHPIQGMLNYEGVQIQIIDQASLKNENFDIGIVNNTDLLLIVVTSAEEIQEVLKFTERSRAKKIIVFNKSDLHNEAEKRKISANLNSKKYNYILTSTLTGEGIKELKEKIFNSFERVRIYLKEPGKEPSKIPMILKPGSTIKDVVEKISKQMLSTISEIHIWGPSSKFPNQKVGLNHLIKDKDIIELKTR